VYAELDFSFRSQVVRLAGRTFELAVLDDDEVLDAVGWDGVRNPYFGQIWPAAIALAEHLPARSDVAGRTVLDLGCGPGLTGIVAAHLGGRVTFADVMPEALALAERNAEANGVHGDLLELDLAKPAAGRRFELLLAADLVYEEGRAGDLATAIGSLLEPGGTALVGDPFRPQADAFAGLASAAGFAVRMLEPGPRVRIFELELTPSVSSPA
jgi:predicted nicotinamide N-methyase